MSEAQALTLEQLLETIHMEVARNMLDDLRNTEKRTPALYQAIIKFLATQGIQVDPSTVGDAPKASAAGQIHQLSTNLPDILDDDDELKQYH